MRCAIASPANPRLRIALRLETKPLTESPGNSLSIRRGALQLRLSFWTDDAFG